MIKVAFKEAQKQLELDLRALQLLDKMKCMKDLHKATEIVKHYRDLYDHLELDAERGAYIVYGQLSDDKVLADLHRLEQRFLNEIRGLIVFNPTIPVHQVFKEVEVGLFKVPPKMVLFKRAH